MADSGQIRCQFTSDYGSVESLVTGELSCKVPSTLSTIGLKCQMVSVSLVVIGFTQ